MLTDSQQKQLKNSILKMIHQAEDWAMDAGLKFEDQRELCVASSRIETLRDVKAVLERIETVQVQVYGTLRS